MNTKDSLIQFIKYQLDRYANNPGDYSQEDILEAKILMSNIDSGIPLIYLQDTTDENFQRMILNDYEEYLLIHNADLRTYHKWLTEVKLAVPVTDNDFTTNKSHWFKVNKILWRQI